MLYLPFLNETITSPGRPMDYTSLNIKENRDLELQLQDLALRRNFLVHEHNVL